MLSETPLASHRSRRAILLAALTVIPVLGGWGAEYPPLSVEISPEHPVVLLQDLPAHRYDADRQRQHILGAWAQVPESLQSNVLFKLEGPGQGEALKQYFDGVLPAFQEPLIPTVVRIADDPQRYRLAPGLLEDLLAAYTMVKGIEVTGLDFRFYDSPRMQDGQTPLVVAWLIEIVEAAARYGRFVYLPMNELQWARVMSNDACEPLYRKIVACRDYVVPACLTRGDHVLGNQSAVMGLWLEGAVSNWGMAADIQWYADARYAAPGNFGYSDGPEKAPTSLYRAMILNGAMTGATVYSFENGNDLWYGPSRRHWDETIFPALRDTLSKVAHRKSVLDRAAIALQLTSARDPQDFHVNLKDIDGVLDEGNLLRAAYGLERPGQITELIPNRGDFYWIPFVSPHATEESLRPFEQVFKAGGSPSESAWAEALAPYRQPIGSGSAFMTRVGFGIFLMNSRENIAERQTYTVDRVPKPVREFSARRDGATVVVEWGYREDALGYLVYKRVLPETHFSLQATLRPEELRYSDAGVQPDQTVAYAVTTQTMEQESVSGVLDYGEYLVLSSAESRIAEEVVLTPVLANATSAAVQEPIRPPVPDAPWWPNLEGVPEARREAARAIVDQIDLWEGSLRDRNLNGIMGVYATSYEDPQHWGFQYAKRSYQQLLERWRGLKLHRQIRRWDFSNFDMTGRINVLLYLRISGSLVTDSSGLVADVPVGIPRTPEAEVWTSWSDSEGVWRMVSTNPALPNFREILSFDAGPYDNFPLGPDEF